MSSLEAVQVHGLSESQPSFSCHRLPVYVTQALQRFRFSIVENPDDYQKRVESRGVLLYKNDMGKSGSDEGLQRSSINSISSYGVYEISYGLEPSTATSTARVFEALETASCLTFNSEALAAHCNRTTDNITNTLES